MLNNRYATVLPASVAKSVSGLNFPTANLSALVKAAKLNTAAAFKAVPGITPAVQTAAVHAKKLAYLKGSKLVFFIAVGFGCVACVAAAFTISIDKRKYTSHTVAVLENEHRANQDKKVDEV